MSGATPDIKLMKQDQHSQKGNKTRAHFFSEFRVLVFPSDYGIACGGVLVINQLMP